MIKEVQAIIRKIEDRDREHNMVCAVVEVMGEKDKVAEAEKDVTGVTKGVDTEVTAGAGANTYRVEVEAERGS